MFAFENFLMSESSPLLKLKQSTHAYTCYHSAVCWDLSLCCGGRRNAREIIKMGVLEDVFMELLGGMDHVNMLMQLDSERVKSVRPGFSGIVRREGKIISSLGSMEI